MHKSFIPIRLREARKMCGYSLDQFVKAAKSDGIWGLSTFTDESHPLIVVDMRPQKTTIERLRFTACHELAHILLHFSDDCNVERCATNSPTSSSSPSKPSSKKWGQNFVSNSLSKK